jgi:hypothetical protein
MILRGNSHHSHLAVAPARDHPSFVCCRFSSPHSRLLSLVFAFFSAFCSSLAVYVPSMAAFFQPLSAFLSE